VGFYNERIDELQAEHPDWFIDEEYDDYEEPIPDPIAQLRNEIRSVIFTMDKGRKSGLWIAGALIAGIIIGALIL
jgi:hypothetical protein